MAGTETSTRATRTLAPVDVVVVGSGAGGAPVAWELAGVEGARLVIQMSSGNLMLLKDEKKRAIRGDLIRLLGKGADVRFIDDKTLYTQLAAPAGTGATAVAAPAAPPLPTNDPVIQAGLRFFGGPLERLPDE